MSLDDSSVITPELYSAPESSSDPYNASSDNTGYPVDLSRLPLAMLGRIFIPKYESRVSTLIQERLGLFTNEIHRRLTPDEVFALASHTHKCVVTTGLAAPIGLSLGMIRAFNTRQTFRFPLFGPLKSENGWFNGERVRFRGMEITGPMVRTIMHGVRTPCYMVLGVTLSTLLTMSYAGTVMAVREIQEPKLANVMQELQNAQMTELDAAKNAERKREPTGQRAQSIRELWKEHKKAISQESRSANEEVNGDGDGSPMAEGFEDQESRTRKDRDFPNILQQSTQDSKRPPASRGSIATNKPFPPQSPSQPPQSEPFQDPYDFADNSSTNDDTSSIDSTWGRIRREAGSSAPRERRGMGGGGRGRGAPQARQEDSPDDDFTFLAEEEERGYARSEAQREFDERVERERRGGEFGDGGEQGGDGDGAGSGTAAAAAAAGWRRERKKRAL